MQGPAGSKVPRERLCVARTILVDLYTLKAKAITSRQQPQVASKPLNLDSQPERCWEDPTQRRCGFKVQNTLAKQPRLPPSGSTRFNLNWSFQPNGTVALPVPVQRFHGWCATIKELDKVNIINMPSDCSFWNWSSRSVSKLDSLLQGLAIYTKLKTF